MSNHDENSAYFFSRTDIDDASKLRALNARLDKALAQTSPSEIFSLDQIQAKLESEANLRAQEKFKEEKFKNAS